MTNTTPNSERLHIVILGATNSGKSSLMNAITGQNTSIVSDIDGTTTDTVSKAIELPDIGASLIIDTPGFDDSSALGQKRMRQTLLAIDKADVAILICGNKSLTDMPDLSSEIEWFRKLKERKIPVITVINKVDIRTNTSELSRRLYELFDLKPLEISAFSPESIEIVGRAIAEKITNDTHSITGNLVAEGDLVMLVMPQDAQAPKGRLILPQVQTIRELLDKKCIIVSCTPEKMKASLAVLAEKPKLIITDSQAFKDVYINTPTESSLTSFSVLFAAYKGDIKHFANGAKVIDELTEKSRVLIAEACTHAPATEDIGRVKIPNLLRKKIGKGLAIDIVSGNDFPEDLSRYDLIIHCGACMFNRKYVLNRIEQAKYLNIPITNYGIALAQLNGILPKIKLP